LLKKFENEREILLVVINAEEKNLIAEKLPNVHIRRTVKQKSKRHVYYMEEDKKAMLLLRQMRQPKSAQPSKAG
jgi:hypothetical protein